VSAYAWSILGWWVGFSLVCCAVLLLFALLDRLSDRWDTDWTEDDE
jgi:hypothetical protein